MAESGKGEAPVSATAGAPKGSVARPIFASLLVVGICGIFLRFGSLIVTVAITHTWSADDPRVSAYAFLFRQFIMVFVYPSVLNLFRPAFVPLYNQIKKQEGAEAAQRFAAGVLEIGMLLSLAVFGVIWLLPELTVGLMAPRFSPEQHAASVQMMRQMGPGILCLLLAEMYLIFFHAEKRFAYPHSAEALQKIVWGLGIVVVARNMGWHDAAIGVSYTLGALVQLVVTAYGMHRTFGWLFRSTPLGEWCRRWGRRAGLLILPLIVGVIGADIRDWVTHWLQTDLDKVSYVSVEFARQLTNLPKAFLGQIISMVMLPHLASILHSHGEHSHRRTLEASVEVLTLLTIPVVAVMFVLAPELTALVFIRADWGPAEHMLCSQGALAIRMVAIGFLFVVIESILLPGLFSIQSMWWPTLWGLAASGVQVLCILGFALADLPKDSTILVAGVAFVYPFSRILKNGILLLVLRKKTGMFPGPSFVVFVGKMLALVLATTLLIFLVHRLWDPVPAAISLDARQVAAKLQPLLGADRAAGLVPMIHLLIYKAKLALQVAVPAAAMLAAYVGMVMAAGYRQDLVELVQSIRRRRQRKPAEEAGNGNGGQDLQSVG